MSNMPQHAKKGDWHKPNRTSYVNRQQWYKPPLALTNEQLDALQETSGFERNLRSSLAAEGPLPASPHILGGWYTPEGSIAVEPARSLSDILPQFGEIPSTAVAALSDEAREALSVQLDTEELAFRQSPQVLGAVPQGFQDAPELPLAANLERGLGGLRDEERRRQELSATQASGDEASGDDDAALTFEEIAQLRESGNVTIDLPARGYGGVSGGLAPEPASMKGDTGEVQVPDDSTFGGGGSKGDAAPISPALTGPVMSVAAQQANNPAFQANQPAIDNQPMTTPQPQQQQSPQQPAQTQSAQTQSAQRFREVEQSVQLLRQQFAQGQITRSQLESELRRLMVLDEQGRWWTLGVDSKRWYRYDGREWVPDVPPQTGAQPALSSSNLNVPTETGLQQAVGNTPNEPRISQTNTPKMAIDEYGMPLPQRVTIDDPGATAVNLNAITAGLDEVTIEKPGPARPADNQMGGISPDQAALAGANVTQEGAIQMDGNEPLSPEDQAAQDNAAPQQTKLTKDGQPDYSAALGSQFSRSAALRMTVWTGLIGAASVLALVFCVLLFSVGYYLNTVNAYSDDIDNLSARASQFETVYIYAQQSDGTEVEIARFNDQERGARTEVALEDISPWAIHALISTEDETYYTNPGFSMWAIGRAAYTNLTSSGPTSGASTITQQLARRLLLDEEFAANLSAERKITEIILANQLSLQYDKNEILELYFNEMSFGGFTVGIEAASQVYFNKPAANLNVHEAAFLVGLVQSPAFYDPFRNRDAAIGRMETVLNLMVNNTGCVQMEHTTNVPGWDLSQPVCVSDEYLNNEVPYEKSEILVKTFSFSGPERRYDHFTLWAWDEVNRMYSQEEIFNNGFRIYTTLNPAVQDEAQNAIRDQLVRFPGVNNASVVAMNPQNGAVIAMVGSADFDNIDIDGEVNVAFTPQQPGSSIKPVVYLAAMEGNPATGEYWSASTAIWDVPSSWPGTPPYEPVNYDGRFRGPVSLRTALSNSLNIPAVKALAFITPDQLVTVANRMGIEFISQEPPNLTWALGGGDVYLFDMVAAYSAFANSGFYFEPYGIQRIENAEGEVLFDYAVNATVAPERTMSPQHAYIISDVLSDSGARAPAFGSLLNIPQYPNAAVKTGTTNDSRDLWTIGWTPEVIVGVWMGNTDNSPTIGTRSSVVPGPVWSRTLVAAMAGRPSTDFPQPPGIVAVQNQVCADSGAMEPAEGCGAGGTIPREIYVDAGVLEDWPQGQLPLDRTEHTFRTVQVDEFSGLVINQYCPNNPVERFFLNIDDPTVVNWLQNTFEGQAWAQSRNIDPTDISGIAPTETCPPDYPQATANLTSPTNGAVLTGRVVFNGTANVYNLNRFEIQYAPVGSTSYQVLPNQTYFDTAVPNNDVLGLWNNSAELTDGQYYIRVEVFSDNGASLASPPITVTIANAPVVVPTTPAFTDTTTPSTGEAIPGAENTGQ